MSKIIDVILQLKDNMSEPMSKATQKLQDSAKQYQRLGRSIQRTGRSISRTGATLTKTITAPVVALGAVAFKEYGEYDKQMRLVQQTMGSTAEESKMLGDQIKKSAANSVYGMQDAADAALNYARAGYSAKQAADMLSPAFNLAAGTATELDTVTAGLSAAMKAFGADSEEASTYADVFAKAQSQAATTVTDLFDATAKASSVFKTAGWNIKDLATATGVLGDAAISGSEGGTALKTGIARLASPAKAGAAWMYELGINIIKADGTFKSFSRTQEILHNKFAKLTDEQKIQAASAIFGKNQMAKWLKIIERSPEDIRRMEAALNGATDTAQNMSDALMEGSGGAIEKLKSNWDIFKNTLGETLAPVLVPMIEKLTEMLQAFSALSEEQKQNIVKWVGIAAAIGPVLMIVGKLITIVGSAIQTIGKLGAAIKGTGVIAKIFSVMSKGMFVGAIGAIITIIGVLVRNWDKITEKIRGFYQRIKPTLDKIGAIFGKVFGFISDLLDNVVVDALGAVLDTIGGIIDALGGVVDFISGVFTGDWEKAWNGICEFFCGIWDTIVSAVKGAVNLIIDILNGLIEGVVYAVNALKDALMEWGISMSGAGGLIDDETIAAMKSATTLTAPKIPNLGVGTMNWGGGIVQISERGGEIVDLPSGSRVYPHDESVAKAFRDGVSTSNSRNVTITIPKLADQIVVREDADIDRIATKLAHKLEKVSQNVGSNRIDYAFQS